MEKYANNLKFFTLCLQMRQSQKIYYSLEELQLDLDIWLEYYNNERPHSGQHCYGKTPMKTFIDSKRLALDKSNEILYLENRVKDCDLHDSHVL